MPTLMRSGVQHYYRKGPGLLKRVDTNFDPLSTTSENYSKLGKVNVVTKEFKTIHPGGYAQGVANADVRLWFLVFVLNPTLATKKKKQILII